MALVGTITKQPREVISGEINYAPVLIGGAIISGTPTHEVTPATATLTVTGVSVVSAGTAVKFYVNGGTDSEMYKVTFLVLTDSGLTVEDEVTVLVEEV